MPAYLHIDHIAKILTDNQYILPKVFVETGTYDFVSGATIYHIWPHFRKLYTIEIVKEYSERAKKKAELAGVTNITFLAGDSTDVLPTVISEINETALFWLDAHFCNDTISPRGHGKIDPPLREEINAIFNGNKYQSIILIDNVSTFGLKNLPYENDWKRITAEYLIQDIAPERIKRYYIENDRLIILMNPLKT